MSELQPVGPLDVFRRLSNVAEDYDRVAAPYLDENPEEFRHYTDKVIELDKDSPLFGHEVIAYGDIITFSVDEEGRLADMALPPSRRGGVTNSLVRPLMKTSGIYNGFSLENIYDCGLQKPVPRVLHLIETGRDKYKTDFGNYKERRIIDYVLVSGSDIKPVLPINAHSMKDLEDDICVQSFNSIASNEDQDRLGIARKVGSYFSTILNANSANDDLNHQRLSYLNSLGFLDGSTLLTRDFVFAEKPYFDEHPPRSFSDMSELVELKPTYCVATLGYEREATEPDRVIFRENLELYVNAITSERQVVLAPLKKITEIY